MGLSGDGSGAAQSSGAGAMATVVALAAPDERRGCGVPTGDRVFQPGRQFVLVRRMLTSERTAADDALHRLGHVEPRVTDGCVQRHDAVLNEPADDRPTQVAREIIPHEDQAQRWQWLAGFVTQPGLPPCGCRALLLPESDRGQGGQQVLQFGAEPRVQHDIGGTRNPLCAQVTGGRAEERQQFGGTPAYILVGQARRRILGLPRRTRLGDCLVGACLILTHQRNPRRLRLAVRSLNQPLFCSVWGSTTVTGPLLRCRIAVPVGHHMRVRW